MSSNHPLDHAEEVQKQAEVALERYDLRGARLDFLKKGRERWLFRVSHPFGGDFLLRIYQPNYVKQDQLLRAERMLHSQLLWLEALRKEMGLSVPDPISAIDGQLTNRIFVEGSLKPWISVLLRWVPGRSKGLGKMDPADLSMVGSYMARLHWHSERYSVPKDFVRPRWDWDGLSGELRPLWKAGKKLYSESEMTLFHTTAEHIQRNLGELRESSEVFGMIHRDLNPGNLIFHEGNVSAIDFDCCGWGYYLYDLALPLLSLEKRHGDRCEPLQNALLEGYQRVRPLSESYIRKYLDTFIAMRMLARVTRRVSTGDPRQALLPSDYMEKLRSFTADRRSLKRVGLRLRLW